MKTKIVKAISEKLNRLLNITDGFGLDLDDYSSMSSGLFPPFIDIDSLPVSTHSLLSVSRFDATIAHPAAYLCLQGFAFELKTHVGGGGGLSLSARFIINIVGVNPVQVLSDISGALGSTFQGLGQYFESTCGPFLAATFDSGAESLEKLAQQDQIKLALDAKIDFAVGFDLGLTSFKATSLLSELSTSLRANITDRLEFELGGLVFDIEPTATLLLEAENSAKPFDVFGANATKNLASFDFRGSFDAQVLAGIEVSAQRTPVWATAPNAKIRVLTKMLCLPTLSMSRASLLLHTSEHRSRI